MAGFSAVFGLKKGRSGDARGVRHLAATFEDHSLVHAEARSENISSEDRWAVNFNSVLSPNVTGYLAADDYRTGIDLAVDTSPFTNDESVWGINLPAESAADPDRALKAKLSLEFAPMVDHSGDLGIRYWDMKVDWLSHIL
jgi:hypothetical protein